eukprot:TRINITY_DN6014_c0_g1_i6.p1 TRINITY_DN6014_c0_g1~~TRINITY_DN6014_c0_g1_i6.p1  ORF type:complete len:171 (-),score=40.86 TRINITY_DN6014_c0_g1_i6:206-718(-)
MQLNAKKMKVCNLLILGQLEQKHLLKTKQELVVSGTVFLYYAPVQQGSQPSGKLKLIGMNLCTIRLRSLSGVWFYVHPAHREKMIWFHAACIAIRYAIECKEDEGLQFVDLGPARTEASAQNKARVGCVSEVQWRERCGQTMDLSIPFRELNAAKCEEIISSLAPPLAAR